MIKFDQKYNKLHFLLQAVLIYHYNSVYKPFFNINTLSITSIHFKKYIYNYFHTCFFCGVYFITAINLRYKRVEHYQLYKRLTEIKPSHLGHLASSVIAFLCSICAFIYRFLERDNEKMLLHIWSGVKQLHYSHCKRQIMN